MNILDSLKVRVKKDGVFVEVKTNSSNHDLNIQQKNDKVSGKNQTPNKQVDMGIFKLAESTFESMVSAGIKNKVNISIISKEFDDLGMSSANSPDELASGINKVFKKYKVDLKAEVRSQKQIAIIKYVEASR